MVSKLTIPGAFDYHYNNCKMESSVENLERSLLEGRKVNQIRLEEIKQLWNRRKGDNFRRRSRRDHAPSRRRRTLDGLESVSKIIDRAWLLIEKNCALRGGGLAVEGEESGLELESEPLMAQGSSNSQQWGMRQVIQIPSEIAEEEKDMKKEDDDRGSEGSNSSIFSTVTEPETHTKGDLKANRDIPKGQFQVALKVESDGDDVSGLSGMKLTKEEGLEPLEPSDWDEPEEKGWLPPCFCLPPPEPPDRGVPMEKGGSPSTFRLRPLEPPDPWPRAAARCTVTAPENTDMAAAARSFVKRKLKLGGAEMELQKLGHFNLMGQAQISFINWDYDKEGLWSSLRQQIGLLPKSVLVIEIKRRPSSQQVPKNMIVGQLMKENKWALKGDRELTSTKANNKELTNDRAGRVQQGECYHLYLQMKILQIVCAGEFLSTALQAPEPQIVQNCMDFLNGKFLSRLLVNLMLKKMLTMGVIPGCFDSVLTIVAGLSARNILLLPLDKSAVAWTAKPRFSAQDYNDHVTLVRVYEELEYVAREVSTKVLVAVLIVDRVVHNVCGQAENAAIVPVHDQVFCFTDEGLQKLWEEGQIGQWDPGGHPSLFLTATAFCFKQWDPGKMSSGSHSLVHLEDKVNFEGEGIDEDIRPPRPTKAYVRRPKRCNAPDHTQERENDVTNCCLVGNSNEGGCVGVNSVAERVFVWTGRA